VQRHPQPFFRKKRQRWCVQFNGKQINLGPDRDEAFRQYHELLSKPKSPARQKQVAEGETVVALIDTFLDWCIKHKAKRTYDWYVERTTSFAKALPADITINQLKPFHVQEWIDAHDDWAPGQKRGCITAIQRVFNWAAKQGRIDRSPIRGMEKPEQGQRTTVISEELYQQVLSVVHSQDFRELLVACWETGCRPQEVISVEARHFDDAQARWVFPAAEAKGKKRIRCVYLTPDVLDIVRRRATMYPTGPLFRNIDGKLWRPQAVACAFTRIQIALGREELKRQGYTVDPIEAERLAHDLRRRGCDHRRGRKLTDKALLAVARTRLLNIAAAKRGPRLCLYNFRHSWATRALERGVDAVTVSVLMGHADTRMLSRVYQHLSQNPAHLQDAVNRATTQQEVPPDSRQVRA
jgi:integrase